MKRHALLLSVLFLAACGSSPKPEAESAGPPAPAVEAPAPARVPPSPPPAPAPAPKPSAPRATAAGRPSPPPPAAATAPAPQASVPALPTRLPERAQEVPIYVPEPRPQAPPEPMFYKVVIPAGTLINIRMIDAINSDTDHVGQAFKASMVSPVILDNETVIPRNADVYVKLVSVKAAGNMSGTSELKVQLDRIFIGKKSYMVESNTFIQAGASQTTKSAKTVGIGTAIGAAIGAISGGRKGAVIGGAAGAGTGVAIEAATKGEQVRIASESPMTFRLEAPLEVVLQGKN